MGAKSRTHFASLEKNYAYKWVCLDCIEKGSFRTKENEYSTRHAKCAECGKNEWLLWVRKELEEEKE